MADLFRQNNASRKVVIELACGLGIAEAMGARDLMIRVPRRLADRLHADAAHKRLRAVVFSNYAGM
ncbi:MAG: hypothetical protein V4573_16725 [Pseudomonadota bacterium]